MTEELRSSESTTFDDGSPAADGAGRVRVDDLDLVWTRRLRTGGGQAFLVDHPWVGRLPRSLGPEVTIGSAWTTCIDLLLEQDADRDGVLWLRGARTVMRHRGRPIGPNEVARLRGFRDPLVLVSAGTKLRLASVSGWSDWHFDSVGTTFRFEIPDGRQFTITTEESNPGEVGMTWSDLLVAAAVVPIDHPLARDDAALQETLARIEAMVAPPGADR